MVAWLIRASKRGSKFRNIVERQQRCERQLRAMLIFSTRTQMLFGSFFCQLSVLDLLALSRVCHKLKSYARSNTVWHHRYRQHYPIEYAARKNRSLRQDWYGIFVAESQLYQDRRVLTLFLLAKEGDTRSLHRLWMGNMRRFEKNRFLENLRGCATVSDRHNYTLWYWLRRAGQAHFVDAMFEQMINIYPHDDADRSEWRLRQVSHLMLAILFHVGPARLQSLLDRSLHVNRNSPCGVPLAFACQYHNISAVRVLLENNALIDRATPCYSHTGLRLSQNPKTPLAIACAQGDLEIVKVLVEKRASIHTTAQAFEHTPLGAACIAGHLPIIRYLVDEKDVGLDQRHHTPSLFKARSGPFDPFVSMANEQGHFHVVAYFLSKGANVPDQLHLKFKDRDEFLPVARMIILKKLASYIEGHSPQVDPNMHEEQAIFSLQSPVHSNEYALPSPYIMS